MKNLVKKRFTTNTTWTAPGGVTWIRAYTEPTTELATSVSTGSLHSMGIKTDGTAYAWGSGLFGRLGDGTTTSKCVPTAICGGLRWKQVSAGHVHSLGISTAGDAYAWGGFQFGRGGNNSITDVCTPTAVCGGLKWKQVSAGPAHSVGITSDDLAYAWGGFNCGGGGDGTITDKCVPTAVCGNIKFKAITTGCDITFGISLSGDLYGWGRNQCGKLGDGTIISKCVPTLVCGGYKWKYVATGDNHSAGITEDGDIYTWGANTCGKLGIGTINGSVCQPTPVCTSIKWKAVSLGDFFTIALTEDGDAWSWGSSLDGQLGDNSPISKCLPTMVCCGLKWDSISVAAIGSSIHGVTCDGLAYGWGINSSGVLGDGTTTTRCVPTSVSCNFIYKANKTQYNKIIKVIPGQSYDVTILSNFPSFGDEPLTGDFFSQSLVIEYFA